MKVESIIKRRNGTAVDLDGVVYRFKPDEQGRHVAEVASNKHLSRLLGIGEGFRLVDDEVVAVPVPPVPVEPGDEGGDGAPEASGGEGGGDAPEAGTARLNATEDMGRDTLAFLWEQKFGKKPHHAKSAKTLVEEINGGTD